MTESIADVTAMDADDRSDYVDSLASSAIIGTITANSVGNAFLYWSQLEHSGDFVVIQTSGVKGCALMPVIDSADATSNGISGLSMNVRKANNYDSLSLYTFSYTDEYTEWAKIDVQKTYESANGVWEDEEGAKFTVTDYFTGEEVAWVVTDSTGYGVACDENGNETKLPYGTYLVSQTASGKGAENTAFADPEIVFLTKQNWHGTVTYTAKNPSEGYLFTLTKLSDDTGEPVIGATYAVVAAEDILNDDGSVACAEGVTYTSVITGEDGTGEVWLPYGYYYAVETESPVTFVKSDKKYYFTLDAGGITVDGDTAEATAVTETDEDGNTTTYYSVSLTTSDTPVYGSIYVTKDGQVVSGKAESGGFTYTSEALEGATFALYARNDILNDAGEVVWAKDTYITSATTDSTGTAQFYWNKDGDSTTGEDGNECSDFYLGEYYVVEISAPEGFVCDTTEHDIGLTWNTSPAEKNDMSDPEESSALYDTENDWESSGDYVLMTGEDFNSLISDAVTITFTSDSPASGTSTTDVSHDGNSSTSKVVMWNDGNGNYYVSTCNSAKAVIFNGNSSNMFANCTSLTAIYFDNVDTSQVIDMRYMFYMCTGLTRLDLTNFDTTNVQYTDYMFMGCTSLVKVYVTEPGSTGSTDYVYTGKEYTSEITAAAAGTVMEGDEITWENFYYTRLYRVDYIVEDNMESIELSASDIASVSPSVASQDDESVVWIDESTYTIKVEITLSKSCKYYCTDGTYSNTLTAVLTVKIPDEDAELQTQEHATAEVALSDKAVTVTIEVEKEDPDGNDLEGAIFELYANCDIKNADGTVVYSAGDLIMKNASGGEEVPVMSFSGLPTNLYAVDGTYLAKQSNAVYCYADGTTGSTAAGDSMFYIIETKAPNGHELDDSVWYLTGSVSDYVASADDDFDGVISYGFTAVNTPLDYLTLEKAWDDSSFSTNRPDYVVFKTSGGTSNYVIVLFEDKAYLFSYGNAIGYNIYTGNIDLSDGQNSGALNSALCSWNVKTSTESGGENGTLTVWQVVLDSSYTKISSSFTASPFTDDSDYTFAENTDLLKTLTKNVTADQYYQQEGVEGWLDADKMVWRATNRPVTDTTDASVTKIWEDYDDDDVTLPTSLSVTLYQEDSSGTKSVVTTRTLSESNDWYYSTADDATLAHTLDKYDSKGNKYKYYWVETLTGDWEQTDYEYAYDEANNVWYTIIENATTITVDASVVKTWDDCDDVDGLQPDVIYVQLYADGVLKSLSTGNALALSKDNEWKATVTGLPKYSSSGSEIKYTFKEITDVTGFVVDKKLIILTSSDVSWYTGDTETGYEVTYGYADSTESGTLTRVTSITNTHKPLGEITIEKTVAVDDVIYYADAHDGENPAISFLFTYADGTEETLELEFDAGTVEDDDTDGDGYVTLSKTYTGLDYGTYSVEELSQPEGWVFSKLTVTNGTSIYATTESREAEFTISAETASNTMIASYEDEYSPKGTITVTKTISEEELQTYLDKYDADPSVTFTLSTDSAGTKVVETQTVTFTADSVAKDGYVTESVTFEDVEPGTYYLSETSMPDTWDFVSLTGTNGKVSGKTISFTLTKANALETFAAVFTDKYPTGEVTVYKKVLAEEVEAYGEDAEFIFTLYDENHKEVEAKTVTIAYDDCVGRASGEYVTAGATFEALELGEYYLEETGMPDEWEFVEIGSVTNGQVISGGDDPDSVYFYLTDDTYQQAFEAVYVDEYINGSITIIKYDNEGNKVDGVTYILYDGNGDTIATKITGEDGTGTVLFEELKKGTYYVTETNTISGLTLLADTITVTIPLVMTDEEIAAYEQEYGITIDTTDAVDKNGEYWFYDLTYEITDTAEISLPMTGGVSTLGTLQIVLLAVWAALIVVVVVVSATKRTEKITREDIAE